MIENRLTYHWSKQQKKLIVVVLIAILPGFVFLATSCKSEQHTENRTITYFDLAGLIEKDIEYNTTHVCSEEKSVYMNGNKETKIMDSINWKSELQPILDCDINKPAWKGKYFVDTTTTTVSNIKSIHYKALSDKVNIKSMVVELNEKAVQRIFITKKVNSFIFSSTQIIEYFPGKGFSVRGEQKAALMKSFDMNVDVFYKCKE